MILRRMGEKDLGRAVHFAAAPVAQAPAAESLLSPKELKKYRTFPVEKRRRDWLAGRWVAKCALLEALGQRDAFSRIEILADDDGQPRVAYPGSLANDCTVSLSHSGGMAAAVVDRAGRPLGLDLERVEARHPAWSPLAFHKDEVRGGADDSELTRLWTIKEAVLKLLGLGLTADLHEVRMRPGLTLYGKALERHRAMGSPRIPSPSGRGQGEGPPRIRLSSWREGDFWYTVAAAGPGGHD